MNRQLAFRIYVGLLAGATLAILGTCGYFLWQGPPHTPWMIGEAALLVPLGWLCSRQQVYFTESNSVLLGTITQIATVIALPLPLAIPVASAAKTANEVWLRLNGRRSTAAVIVNVGAATLNIAASATLFNVLRGPEYLWAANSLSSVIALPALIAMGAAYFISDIMYVSIAITLSTRDTLHTVVRRVGRDTSLPDLSLLFVGIVFAILLHYSPLLSLFVIVPVYLSVRSFAAVARLREETERAIMHLAKSVDMRDTGTGVHSQQLEQAAKRLAKAIGLLPEHVHEIGLAARAHDLGKIEISDSILLKNGPLTQDERDVIEEHPVIGATMLSSYTAFEKSVAYVRHHHERWDGRGYPDRLQGEDIPIGARIIAVVDSYDAMTADRPYRKALSVDEAVTRLKAGMGTQFDPRICATWVQLLIEDGVYIPKETAPHLQIVASEAS